MEPLLPVARDVDSPGSTEEFTTKIYDEDQDSSTDGGQIQNGGETSEFSDDQPPLYQNAGLVVSCLDFTCFYGRHHTGPPLHASDSSNEHHRLYGGTTRRW